MFDAYSRLAVIYDRVMMHVDYEKWFDYITKIDKKYHIQNKNVLELGGGTGNLASFFVNTEWNWHLTDYSRAMLKEARLKTKLKDEGSQLSQKVG